MQHTQHASIMTSHDQKFILIHWALFKLWRILSHCVNKTTFAISKPGIYAVTVYGTQSCTKIEPVFNTGCLKPQVTNNKEIRVNKMKTEI